MVTFLKSATMEVILGVLISLTVRADLKREAAPFSAGKMIVLGPRCPLQNSTPRSAVEEHVPSEFFAILRMTCWRMIGGVGVVMLKVQRSFANLGQLQELWGCHHFVDSSGPSIMFWQFAFVVQQNKSSDQMADL